MDRNFFTLSPISAPSEVALRKESVDRNYGACAAPAWPKQVALRKESVDRNAYGRRITRKITRRSPQGERG